MAGEEEEPEVDECVQTEPEVDEFGEQTETDVDEFVESNEDVVEPEIDESVEPIDHNGIQDFVCG